MYGQIKSMNERYDYLPIGYIHRCVYYIVLFVLAGIQVSN